MLCQQRLTAFDLARRGAALQIGQKGLEEFGLATVELDHPLVRGDAGQRGIQGGGRNALGGGVLAESGKPGFEVGWLGLGQRGSQGCEQKQCPQTVSQAGKRADAKLRAWWFAPPSP